MQASASPTAPPLLATRTGPAPAPAAQPSEEGQGHSRTRVYTLSPSSPSSGAREVDCGALERSLRVFSVVEALLQGREARCEFQVLTLSTPTWCPGTHLDAVASTRERPSLAALWLFVPRCARCGGFLWGLRDQGSSCSRCGQIDARRHGFTRN